MEIEDYLIAAILFLICHLTQLALATPLSSCPYLGLTCWGHSTVFGLQRCRGLIMAQVE